MHKVFAGLIFAMVVAGIIQVLSTNAALVFVAFCAGAMNERLSNNLK